MQHMQTECLVTVSQLREQITEREEVISTIKDDIKARTGENFIVSAQLTLRQSELEQSIDRCNILEEKFKREPAEREESWDRREKEVEKLQCVQLRLDRRRRGRTRDGGSREERQPQRC